MYLSVQIWFYYRGTVDMFRPRMWLSSGLGRKIIQCACTETNFMHYLYSVYLVNIPLHVSGLLIAHHQEVAIYICDNTYQVLHTYIATS
jgi:hypothetical protein